MNMITSGGSSGGLSIKLTKENGSLSKTQGQKIVDFSGVTTIPSYGMDSAYRGISVVTPTEDGVLNLSSIQTLSDHALESTFLNTSGITQVVMNSTITLNTWNCMNCAFGNSTIQSADLSGVTEISGQGAAQEMFRANQSLTTVNLTNLETISGANGANGMFTQCHALPEISLPLLSSISGTGAAQAMFYDCGNLASIDMPSLYLIDGDYAAMYMFQGVAVSTIRFPALRYISGYSAMQGAFMGANVDRVRLTNLRGIGGQTCFYQAFYATPMTVLSVPRLTSVSGQQALIGAFGATGLTEVRFYNLALIRGVQPFDQAFLSCANLANLYFYAIDGDTFDGEVSAFNRMLRNCPNVTVHFPSNRQTLIEGMTGYSTTAPFGATAGQVLFDLPPTATLTVSTDTGNVQFKRSPAFDEDTQGNGLAWRGAEALDAEDQMYYTSGTSLPAVNDSLYSDSACTTSVGTITAVTE